jgi:hypothetical protein
MMSEDVMSTELVKRSLSSVYPAGDAALAWQALRERYEPRNAVDQQTLLTELCALRLDMSKGPEVWIVELLRMQSQLNGMGATVSDNMFDGPHSGRVAKGIRSRSGQSG